MEISRCAEPRLLREKETMDATKLVEEYEAIHGKDDYTSDLESLLCWVIDDEADESAEMYTPEWAEQQTAFLASC